MNKLASTIKAISDPTRLRIILLLVTEGELCVCDLMAVLKLPQSTVSRHLAYLKRNSWVDIRREGVWMYYKLSNVSCSTNSELLTAIKHLAQTLPEVVTDTRALAIYQKTKNEQCCP